MNKDHTKRQAQLVSRRYGTFQKRDMQEHRWISALSYLFFFLPLILCPESKYGRFHASQSFILMACHMIATLTVIWIPVIGRFLVTVISLLYIFLVIWGISSALSIQLRLLPLLGRIRIFPNYAYEEKF